MIFELRIFFLIVAIAGQETIKSPILSFLKISKQVETISANVVFHPSETKLPIDHNEFYAINDKGSFSLLLHGTQAKNSLGSKAIKRMNKEDIKYSYSR